MVYREKITRKESLSKYVMIVKNNITAYLVNVLTTSTDNKYKTENIRALV